MRVPQKYIFAGAYCYNFNDRQTRKNIRGTKVHLLPLEMERADDTHGYIVEIVGADYSLFDDLRKLQPMKPYEFLLEVDVAGKKKPRIISVAGEVKAA